MVSDPADLIPLPEGSVLLHIGPHKTGTTAIQLALAASRPQLSAAGVTYPGHGNQHSREAMALLGGTFGFRDRGGGGFPMREWERLVRETNRARSRVVISSEFFDDADVRQERRIAEDLGHDRVRVVVTLRPLAKILPSAWQQTLKVGRTGTYPWWLETVLADTPEARRQNLWTRHAHGELVARWVEVFGADRVTVVVLDERDRTWLYRVFERLLALEPDTLTRPPGDSANRSMSALECELLRRVNNAVSRHEVPWADYQHVIRDGAFRRILTERKPAAQEGPISTPGWALDRAAELGAVAAQQISDSGARVIGDLDRLTERPPEIPEAILPAQPELRLMVQLVVGALSGSMRRGPDFGDVRTGWPPSTPTLDGVPTRHLARVLRGRVTGAARRRLRHAD